MFSGSNCHSSVWMQPLPTHWTKCMNAAPHLTAQMLQLSECSYSTIHKAAGLTVPGHSMILTGTIPVEHKSVHWLSMGATSRNGLGGYSSWQFFWERSVTKELVALWIALLTVLDLKWATGTCSPEGSRFFHAVFGNRIRLAHPLWELAPPQDILEITG